MDDLVLTDDEAVAVAIGAGTYWPGPLPTVDAADLDTLRRAASRGHRSLAIRDLNEAELAELDTFLATRSADAPYAVTYLANDDLTRDGWRWATTHHHRQQGWLVDKVDAFGLHQFVEAGDDEHDALLHGLVESAFTNGPDRDPAWLCVATVEPAGTNLLGVRRRECFVAGLSPDGAERTRQALDGLDAALAHLSRLAARIADHTAAETVR